MKSLIAAFIAAFVLAISSGCIGINYRSGIPPLVAESGITVRGDATVTDLREHTAPNGKVTTDDHTVTKSEAAADLEIKLAEIRARRDVAIERERAKTSSGPGFWATLFGPSPGYYGYPGGYGGGYTSSVGGTITSMPNNASIGGSVPGGVYTSSVGGMVQSLPNAPPPREH